MAKGNTLVFAMESNALLSAYIALNSTI